MSLNNTATFKIKPPPFSELLSKSLKISTFLSPPPSTPPPQCPPPPPTTTSAAPPPPPPTAHPKNPNTRHLPSTPIPPPSPLGSASSATFLPPPRSLSLSPPSPPLSGSPSTPPTWSPSSSSRTPTPPPPSASSAGPPPRCSLSPYSWNLAVDLLSKNRLFDAMWEALRSMRSQSILSLATFASVFSSYTVAGDFPAVLKVFEEMQPLFGIPRNTTALNSLLSPVCREGQAAVARDYLRMRRREVPPNGDNYAILLEEWENEGDARRARDTFDEMVERVGWDPKNVPAYDSFLCTLLRGSGGTRDALRYLGILKEKSCYPGVKFFRNALEELVKADDARGAAMLWETLVGMNGCYPDSKMYTSMIALQCYAERLEAALKYLDEMVVYGAFPDGKTYNVLLQYLLKGKKTRDAAAIFEEMVKNEFVPSEANCASAVRVFLDEREWEMGIKVWKCMVEHGYPSEESGNEVVTRLKDLDRLPEACKFAEDMIDRRVKLNSANLSRLRTSLLKIGKGSIYDHLLRKWKLH